jgi:hypothetical protein
LDMFGTPVAGKGKRGDVGAQLKVDHRMMFE